MLELKNIKKSYKTNKLVQRTLKGINLKFYKNEFVAILGPSGSGKTTLLNIIGGLDRYDEGNLIINQKNTKEFKENDWDAYRNNCVGFIFQNYNLLNHISILANVEIGMTLSGLNAKQRRKKAIEALTKVGLQKHLHKKPNQLSGGQMQRVAIARAISNNPDIILADEPTGALDSKTSVQIMNLIKKISKNKLVIMVTHNSTLANDYANRIISMKDGKIINDTNDLKEETDNQKVIKLKKTSMKFFTALHLSFNNLKTKKGRTILTSFASSIGIIGIALILSLSNGFNKQISLYEKTTLSTLPIVISSNIQSNIIPTISDETSLEYPNFDYVIPSANENNDLQNNSINNNQVNYLKKINKNYISEISYTYQMNLNFLQKINGKVNISTLNYPETINSDFINKRYDVLAGKIPTSRDEVVLEVDSKNQVSKDYLEILGFKTSNNINFNDILNRKINLVLNQNYYQKISNYFVTNQNLDSLYENQNNIILNVVGIIRLKKDYPNVSNSKIYFSQKLFDYLLDLNKNSNIVKEQEKVDYNVISGEKYDLTTIEGQRLKENVLSFLGANLIPLTIQIYPQNFESKEFIIDYLDKYNNGKTKENMILYTDEARMMSTLSNNIIDSISIVLIAFSSISLIVSCIMISIIMYISVLERTKEIGILRSLGASKKDITRVFNAETFIIGITSGVIGIFLARLFIFPTNFILYSITKLENIAILNPFHSLLLILISVILTIISGFIPAKIASKKNLVEALRTE